MATKHRDRPTLHALLIAADCYLPNRLPEGSYHNLGASAMSGSSKSSFASGYTWTKTAWSS